MEFLVRVEGLQVDCLIGVLEHERQATQRLRVDASLWVKLAEPLLDGASTEGVVDYAQLATRIVGLLVDGRFFLLEVACRKVLELCLEDGRVVRASVKLTKALALAEAEAASVECRGGSGPWPLGAH